MDNDREKALIRQCRQGDRQALTALVEEYEGPVYNAVYRMLGSADEAADVTQTAFLKALENLDRFDPTYRFFSWLYRIAMNEAIDRIKQSRRFEPMPDSLADPGSGPGGEAEQAESGERVQTALLGLGEELRAVMVLRYFVELSYDEIAAVLDIPAKTVKSRLFTGRQRLKQRLERTGALES